MNHYLAKPDESIIGHTNNLIEQYDVIMSIYGDLISVNHDDLLFICKWHDIGKVNPDFQSKLQGTRVEDELYHNFLSAVLMQPRVMYDEFVRAGVDKDVAKQRVSLMAYAVACHHVRTFNDVYQDSNYMKDFITRINDDVMRFDYSQVGLVSPSNIKLNYRRFIRLGDYPTYTNGCVADYLEYVRLKGLLNKIDYAASGHYPVEICDTSLPDNLQHWQMGNNITWNKAQDYAYHHRNESTVFVAQTGIGKTEAALRWIDRDKGFFTLPLQAAINNIYDRVQNGIQIDHPVGILHSNAYDYLADKEMYAYDKVKLSRSLSYPITITTIDQLFKFVYRYSNYESLYSTMMYSKVVIDEIQAYDAILTAYLIYGLKMIDDIGGKYLIMSATIPPYLLDIMRFKGLDIPTDVPVFYDDSIGPRHSVSVIQEQITADNIIHHYNGGRALVVCNTIKQAIQLYKDLDKGLPNVTVRCLHSRFIKGDRKILESEIIACGQSDSDEDVIWVSTQIVEASLDIDFDMLFTELSELSGLYQRMGRCYRKREYCDDGYNVFIYDGGNRPTSGIYQNGGVVDYTLFNLSKSAIRNISGLFDERSKIEVLNNTYSLSNVADTDFYQEIMKTLRFLDALRDAPGQASHKDVKRIFRNIDTVTVIPKSVYVKHKDIIEAYLQDNDHRSIDEYVVSIYRNKLSFVNDYLPFRDGLSIGILDCDYDNIIGVNFDD